MRADAFRSPQFDSTVPVKNVSEGTCTNPIKGGGRVGTGSHALTTLHNETSGFREPTARLRPSIVRATVPKMRRSHAKATSASDALSEMLPHSSLQIRRAASSSSTDGREKLPLARARSGDTDTGSVEPKRTPECVVTADVIAAAKAPLPTRGAPKVMRWTSYPRSASSNAASVAIAPPSEWPVTRSRAGAARGTDCRAFRTGPASDVYADRKPRCTRQAVQPA